MSDIDRTSDSYRLGALAQAVRSFIITDDPRDRVTMFRLANEALDIDDTLASRPWPITTEPGKVAITCGRCGGRIKLRTTCGMCGGRGYVITTIEHANQTERR